MNKERAVSAKSNISSNYLKDSSSSRPISSLSVTKDRMTKADNLKRTDLSE